MKFTKMQGCGNDYIYINESEEKIPAGGKACLVKRMSDRHYGIGGDGVNGPAQPGGMARCSKTGFWSVSP